MTARLLGRLRALTVIATARRLALAGTARGLPRLRPTTATRRAATRWLGLVAATMDEGELTHGFDVLFADRVALVPGSMGTRRAQQRQIGAYALDLRRMTELSDAFEPSRVERHRREP